MIHEAILGVHSFYMNQSYKLPKQQSEAWYRIKLWGFLTNFIDAGGKLEYQPGETTCRATMLRMNLVRDLETRHQQGPRVDGMITSSITQMEMCAIEAGKVDEGTTGTKVLHDCRKLAKTMKDMFDLICNRCPADCRRQLATFGILLSGANISFVSLRYVDGRYYRLHVESSISFPPTWDDEGIVSPTIITLMTKLVHFKQRVEQMAKDVAVWVQVWQESDDPQDE
ncbi:hypothetical protein BGX34_008104, partial [Mortierella sp. NVP85]